MEAVKAVIKELRYSPNSPPVLQNIDLRVQKGELVAIAGASGSGKSTLLNALTTAAEKFYEGILEGEISLLGEEVSSIPLPQMNQYLAYMRQEPQNQILTRSGFEEVAFALCNRNLSPSKIRAKTQEMLEFVGMAEFQERDPSSLSGGQAQRIVLASVLALDSPLLFFDQPAAELDPEARRNIYQYLGQLKAQGATILLVIDRADEMLNYADRVIIMQNGTIERELNPPEYFQLFKPADNFPAVSPPTKSALEVLKAKDLSYSYDSQNQVLKQVNFSLYQGELVALVGANGSGKSTLLQLLEGLLKPEQGEIIILGEKLGKKNLKRLRQKIGFLFQNPDLQLFCDTVYQEVAYVLQQNGLAPEIIREKVLKVLKMVGLEKLQAQNPQKLSRGQRQLTALASCLVSEPPLVLADEATSGLNEEMSRQVLKLLQAYAARGNTVLLVTHDLELVRPYAQSWLIMQEGGRLEMGKQ